MSSISQLKEFLEEISEDAKFLKFKYYSPLKYDALIKCKVEKEKSNEYYKDYVKNWLKRFSNFTNTIWMVRPCYPEAKRFMFKKFYICHRDSYSSKSTPGKQAPKEQRCRANINFKISNNDDLTVTKDRHLQEGLNMTIAIEFDHTHSLKKKLNFPNNVELKYHELFNEGYTTTSARWYYDLLLREKDEQDSRKVVNPSLTKIKFYRDLWDKKETNELIKTKVEKLEKLGHTVVYNEKLSFIVIMTPLMKRVMSQVGLQRVLIDATLEDGAPYTIFLYVPSMVGSLPIAYATFTELNKELCLQILLTIKMTIEKLAGVTFEPEVLLHDDDLVIKDPLLVLFKCSRKILNRYTLCRDFWRWICEDQRIKKVIRPSLKTIALFKSFVLVKSLSKANVLYDKLTSSSMPTNCCNKVSFIWQNRQQWIDDNKLCDGFNDVPISCRKEFILQVCRPFNGRLPAMLDVITNVIDKHDNKILLAHRDGDIMSAYTKFLPKVSIDSNSVHVTQVGPNEYHIQDELNPGHFPQVDTDTMCCDCSYGTLGRICKHLGALLPRNDDTFVSNASLDDKEINTFLEILTGPYIAIKCENENDLLEIEETAVDDNRPKSYLPSKGIEENNDSDIKEEMQDLMEVNHEIHEDENINDVTSKPWLSISSKGSEENYDVEIKSEELESLDTYNGNESSASENGEDMPKKDFKEQYEDCMKCVNAEFRRLNKLFKENPNGTNLYILQRLTKELGKIVVVEEVDLSNMFVKNNTIVTKEI